MIDLARSGLGLIDPGWRWVRVNQPLADLLGVDPEDLRGTKLTALLSPEDEARCGDGSGDLDLCIVALGKQLRLQISGDTTDTGHRVVTASRPALPPAAHVLAGRASRLRNMANSLPVMIWAAGPDGACYWFNDNWLRYRGRTLQEEQGDGWLSAIHPDDLEQGRDVYRRCFESRAPFEKQCRLRRHDGVYRWFLDRGVPTWDERGHFTGFIGSCVDVTDHKRTEAELRRANERLALAQRGSRSGVWDWDVPNQQIYWSPAYRELYGLPDDTQPSLHRWIESVHSDDRERLREFARAQLADPSQDQWYIEFRIVHPHNGVRWLAGIGAFQRDDRGRALRVTGINIDITERRETEEALKEQHRRKDEFLAVLGHELRNPLAALRGGVDLLGMGKVDLDWVQQMMDKQVAQLTGLVDDLLDLTRVSRGRIKLRYETTTVGKLVERAAMASQQAIEPGDHRLHLDVEDPDLPANVDAVRMEQVLVNLLVNAARHSPRGAQVELKVRRRGDELSFTVSDSGDGLAREDFDRIFEPFVQLSGPGAGGLGIGLTLVRQLVSLHQGRVEVRSDGRGQGASFEVIVPLTKTISGDIAAEAASRPSASLQPLRVLVVDDNVDLAHSLELLLQQAGHEAEVTHTGAAGISAARELRPELVLLDVSLPDMQGDQVASRLRDGMLDRHAVIAAMTGFGQEDIRERTLQAGCDRHLLKPVDRKALDRLVAEVAYRKQELDPVPDAAGAVDQ